MLSDSGAAAMVEFYRKAAEDASTDTDRARISALVADALRDTDPIASVQAVSDVLAAEDAEDRPLLALAVLALALAVYSLRPAVVAA